MGKNTSISIGDHFEDFIQKEITNGRYNSADEMDISRSSFSRLIEKQERKLLILLYRGEVLGIWKAIPRWTRSRYWTRSRSVSFHILLYL